MTTLTSRKPKDTYKDLLQISNSNSGVDSTLRNVEDGEGTASVLQLSTTNAAINSVNGLDVLPGSDADADLLSVSVTGSPRLWWDESDDRFSLTHGLDIDAGNLSVAGASSLVGDVLLGTGTAQVSGWKLDILDTGSLCALLANNETDAATKIGSIGGRHYTNAEETYVAFTALSNASFSVSYLGNGTTAALNGINRASTFINADHTTIGIGTEVERHDFTKSNLLNDTKIGGALTDTPAARLHVSDTTNPQALFEDTAASGVIEIQLKNPSETWDIVLNGAASDEFQIRSDTGTPSVRLDTAGNALLGSALAVDSTDGFLHIPRMAGTPISAPPTTHTGFVPMCYDTSGEKLWIYNGAWVGVVLA